MAASSTKGEATPDDIMDAAAMKPLLMLSKREPVNCALGLTAGKAGVLLLHKKSKPKKVLADLKSEAKKIKLDLENGTLRFGTAEVDPEVDSSLVLFRINKEVPGMVGPKLREHLKKAGISKVEFIVDPSLEDEAEEDGPQPEAAPHQAPEQAPPDWPGLTMELATLAKTIATAAGGNPARQQTLVQLATAANVSLKAGQDFPAATQAVAALRQALQDGPGAHGHGDEPENPEDPLDLKNRMATAARQLTELKTANDPAFASLLAAFSNATGQVKAKSPEAGDAVDALESALAQARSAARGRAAGVGNAGKVAYAKLLLRWHDAQAKVDQNLKALGAAILADPEIQDDPDFPEIEQSVADLPYLVPELGEKLDDVLDAARDPAADTKALNREALSIITEYRSRIGAVSGLRELEPFSASTAAGKIDLFSEFSTALNDLEAELLKAA